MPIVGALVTFLQQETAAEWWEGEVPRWDTAGNPIGPTSIATGPTNWPVFRVLMPDSGLVNGPTLNTGAYKEEGDIYIETFGTGRAQVEGLIFQISNLLALNVNWAGPNSVISQILQTLGNNNGANPNYVIKLLRKDWTCVMEEGLRLQQGQLCYHGMMHYEISLHGSEYI